MFTVDEVPKGALRRELKPFIVIQMVFAARSSAFLLELR